MNTNNLDTNNDGTVTKAEVLRLLAQAHQHATSYADQSSIAHGREQAEAVATEREQAENHRANRRNRNRMIMLLTAVGMGFVTPWMLPFLGIPAAYAFLVAIVPDTFITVYAYIRKY